MSGNELTREQWIAHLEVHGWRPISARYACVLRDGNGPDRVYLSKVGGRMCAKFTADPPGSNGVAVPSAWEHICDEYLRLLGAKTMEVQV